MPQASDLSERQIEEPTTPAPPLPSLPGHAKSSSLSQIYVLSADGSKLFLIDPSSPSGNEQPPAYDSILSPSSAHQSIVNDDQDAWVQPGNDGDDYGQVSQAGPSSPRSVTIHPLPSHRSFSSLPPESSRAARTRSSSESGRTRIRARANTASAANPTRAHFRRTISAGATPRRVVSVRATSYVDTGTESEDEITPLLGEPTAKRRGIFRSILSGELDEGDDDQTWRAGWRRYWRPLAKSEYWRAALHLVLLNFPFALLVWPFLFAGTVAGTALLITLPIGAVVWWLTLILARTAAKLEVHHHCPRSEHGNPPRPAPQPIFHRRASNLDDDGQDEMSVMEQQQQIWETGFLKCSYAMFCDHYSYSALTYFLLYKPIITLFSTILILPLLIIGFASGLGLPVALRTLRRWGLWQYCFAIQNL